MDTEARTRKNIKIKVACGRESLTVSLPGRIPATVEHLLNCVQTLHPQMYAAWCDEHNRLRESLPVFVNGEHVRYRQGLQTELKDGDDVYVIPLIAGG